MNVYKFFVYDLSNIFPIRYNNLLEALGISGMEQWEIITEYKNIIEKEYYLFEIEI